MILSALVLSAALSGVQDAKPVVLNRVFPQGEKLQYAIASNLHVEIKPYGLQTFMPDDLDLNYRFTTEVKALKPDGIAVIHYQRPTMTQIDGENASRPSQTTVEKVGLNMDLTVSPINVILEQKDLNPPKKKTPKSNGGDDDGLFLRFSRATGRQTPLSALMGPFVSELYRLCLNVGSIDSALDFSPKLPFDEVKIGDTWKKTISYQPQKLKGKDGQSAVQRLDYTFTYKGLVTLNGKKFYRVNASLDLNTDLGDYINQMVGGKPEQTHLKSIPFTLKQSIDFDLDLATKRTIAAHSKSEGGYKVMVTDDDDPRREEKMTGTTEMKLVSMTTAAPVKSPVKPKGKGGKG